jgi:hypothetical protein
MTHSRTSFGEFIGFLGNFARSVCCAPYLALLSENYLFKWSCSYVAKRLIVNGLLQDIFMELLSEPLVNHVAVRKQLN